ncbi:MULTISPECIES: hypothetical protein [Streptomyces]|uniref:hypothetical protein n=1 Tax=Streptomyces TaxID=1883 RepID=UPI0004A9F359|nr:MULTISPECIES: hypothetical protein [Streptomyces]
MPLRPARPSAAALAGLLLATGCTTVGGPSGEVVGPGRELTAAQLRAAALADADLGPGYTVTVVTPGHGDTGAGSGRETADTPACQPLLDVVAPVAPPGPAAASASPASGRPYAETDLSVARAADPAGGVYGGLLGYRAGRAAAVRVELEGLFGPCASFTSTAPPPPAEKPGKRVPIRTRHRLNRVDTPTPGGADEAIGFTLTNESGTAVLAQRAVLARVGPALAVFTTFGVAAAPAAAPDERIVRQQVAKLRAAEAGA